MDSVVMLLTVIATCVGLQRVLTAVTIDSEGLCWAADAVIVVTKRQS